MSAIDSKVKKLAYTIPEFCIAVSVGRNTAYRLLESGRVRSVLVGGTRRIPVEDAERLVHGLPPIAVLPFEKSNRGGPQAPRTKLSPEQRSAVNRANGQKGGAAKAAAKTNAAS
jgi:excisionase family DNA binding protein